MKNKFSHATLGCKPKVCRLQKGVGISMRAGTNIEKQKEEQLLRRKRWINLLENLFVVVLAFYPLRHISWGLDLWDTGYNYANFQFMGTEHMDSMWLFSTYLSNAVGHFLAGLGGSSLVEMNLYTGLFVSLLALAGYFFCVRVLKIPSGIAFVGELTAVSLCWCPTALLYNYLTYVLLLACVILLYLGLTGEKKWCLFGAGICLGLNVFVRFSNLPEAVLILAVWAYDVILEWDIKKAQVREQIPESFWARIGRHTLWCLMGYLAALAALLLYIHLRYGFSSYVEGIMRLFAMTDTATDYRASSMVLGMIRIYVDHLYWVVRIGAVLVGGMAIVLLSDWLNVGLGRLGRRFSGDAIKGWNVVLRVLMGLISLAIATGLYFQGFLSLLLQGGVSVKQFGMLFLALIMLIALAACAGRRVFAALLGIAMLGWLYYREFCSLLFYSYDPILRPGVLFLMLTMFISVIRILHPEAPREEKLVSGMILLVVLVTSIGSNNGIYPSLNNLFLAAPYTFWQSACFLRNKGKIRLGKIALSALPAKGMLIAFLGMCLFQFGAFGAVFVFVESTGVQNPDSYVENNEVLEGVRMSEDKARWLSEISSYVSENRLQGKEVILYGYIPSLSYYLQMPSAFNPWSDLDSYSLDRMELDLEDTARVMESDAENRPVIILEREYAACLEGDLSALKELGVGEQRILAIEQDQKWVLLSEFMEEHGYRLDFENEKFALYR